jgi:hypothetical protein
MSSLRVSQAKVEVPTPTFGQMFVNTKVPGSGPINMRQFMDRFLGWDPWREFLAHDNPRIALDSVSNKTTFSEIR